MSSLFIRIAAVCIAVLFLTVLGFVFGNDRIRNISGAAMMSIAILFIADAIAAMLYYAFI